MCTTFLLGHWQPLSWLSCALDYQAWGLNSQGWHATNLLIHAVNAVLVYGLCLAFGRRTHPALTGTPPSEGICKTQGITLMAGDPHHDRGGHPCCLIQSPPLEGCPKGGVGCYAVAALAALFWAVHPLRVEAVAWLSTRGYLLCTTFCLLTVLFYFREVGTVRRTVRGRLGEASLPNRYPLAALLCFTLATCTKGIGMMLPFVLLLIDWQWAKSREQGAGREERGLLRKKVVEKIPFFALSLVTGITAFLAKKADGGMVSLESHSLWTRIGQAVYCFWFYIWKTVAPEGLSPLYYRLPNSVVSSALLLAALLLFLLAFLWRRRHPWFLLVLAAYVLLIFPMLGITQSGACGLCPADFSNAWNHPERIAGGGRSVHLFINIAVCCTHRVCAGSSTGVSPNLFFFERDFDFPFLYSVSQSDPDLAKRYDSLAVCTSALALKLGS